jgi:hypothetical protein
MREENAALSTRLAEAEAALAAHRAAAGGATGPRFDFGEVGRLDAVRTADWPMLAGASVEVSKALFEVLERAKAGEKPSKDVQMRLQENTERMRTYEYRTIDRIPTSAKHNGEFTHPVSLANLIAAILERGGKPLDEAQEGKVRALGEAFEREFARVRAGWAPGVPRARRMLEEYRAKGAFTEGLWSVLTAEQRALWIDPALRGVAGIDLHDPTLMILHTTLVVTGATVPEARAKLGKVVRGKLGLDPAASAPALDRDLDAFLARFTPTLEPVAPALAARYSYAQGLLAGEATADLVDALLRDSDLPPATRQALFDDFAWYLPRLVRA